MDYNLGSSVVLTIAFSKKAFPIDCTLDDSEKKRASMFRFEHLREQYIFAHAFKRRILSHYFPFRKATEWYFAQTSSGKPFIKEGIAFNLSHSTSSVAVALVESTDKSAVGVDIECFREMDDLESMIEMVCHSDEIQQLDRFSDRSKGFFKLWTAKEALLKACGSGLIDDLNHINCLPSLLSDQVYPLNWQGNQYCLQSISFDWGVITAAWSTDLPVSDIRLDNWASGVPVSEAFCI
ncbi:4'-phosphopantetheinyl transferase family protein [Marinomonas polaris]|uniref:4'-phosphopantetheinyl transferase family protein n=1 Tax=Marinomonas polaris TaxID=293552 RepID=UPI003F966070